MISVLDINLIVCYVFADITVTSEEKKEEEQEPAGVHSIIAKQHLLQSMLILEYACIYTPCMHGILDYSIWYRIASLRAVIWSQNFVHSFRSCIHEESNPDQVEGLPNICPKWTYIGYLLDISDSVLESILSQYHGDLEECCHAVLRQWLDNGSPDYSLTWEGLFELLEDADCAQVGEVLRDYLNIGW